MAKMEQITVTCTDNGKTQVADVLSRSDKSIRCVFVGTTVTLNLSRTDVRRPYTTKQMGLEFSTEG